LSGSQLALPQASPSAATGGASVRATSPAESARLMMRVADTSLSAVGVCCREWDRPLPRGTVCTSRLPREPRLMNVTPETRSLTVFTRGSSVSWSSSSWAEPELAAISLRAAHSEAERKPLYRKTRGSQDSELTSPLQ